jgi:tRNA (guanine37-N1)-methyltransferase
MRLDVVTIFPEYLAPLSLSLVGKARESGILDLHVHDLRDWTDDRHRTVDDAPYGGGAGMVMAPEPWGRALAAIRQQDPARTPHLLVTSPSGRPLTQRLAHQLAAEPWLVIACGRYEGIDARVMEEAAQAMSVDEVSVGDVVLAGGDAAALVITEAVVRLLPGVLGNPSSLVEESYADGLLEYPVYTRPARWRDREVPSVLLSGDHARIAAWRRAESVRRTALRRPDLVEAAPAEAWTGADREVLTALGWALGNDGRFRRPSPPVAH